MLSGMAGSDDQGAFLGYLRCRDILPADKDLDIGYDVADADKFSQHVFKEPFGNISNSRWRDIGDGLVIAKKNSFIHWVIADMRTGAYIDVWWYVQDKKTHTTRLAQPFYRYVSSAPPVVRVAQPRPLQKI